MIRIPDHSTILAPTSLHLPLYEQIAAQKGNCLNIRIYSLETYLQTLFEQDKENKLSILMKYQRALSSLDPKNTFYHSRNDFDFLNACLQFLSLASLLDVSDFPNQSQKEKDLYTILSLLKKIPLFSPTLTQAKALDPDFSNLYILEGEKDIGSLFWTDHFLSKGAHLLKGEQKEAPQYFSCANTRKEIEVLAELFLSKKVDIENSLIALAQESDLEVFSQIFDAHHIPYTPLKRPLLSTIKNEFIAVLKYLHTKNNETFLALIQTLFPDASKALVEYERQFPDVDLLSIEYEDNALISQEEFIRWQQLELEAKKFQRAHQFIDTWSLEHMESICTLIQSLHPDPNEDDLAMFDAIVQDLASVLEDLKDQEDLSLFIQYLEKKTFNKNADTLKGVLVGGRKEMSGLSKTTILVGAHALLFPSLQVYGVIFDESYLQNTGFPSLKDRLQMQRKNIFGTLDSLDSLIVLIPQSDYHGKSLESSSELDAWMKKRPTFQAILDPYGGSLPRFALAQGQAASLFFKNNSFSSNYSKIQTFNRCPLRHYLRYGLQIKKAYKKDGIQLDRDLVSRILQKARLYKSERFQTIDHEAIRQIIQEEFSFAMKVFWTKKKRFETLIDEFSMEMLSLIQVLDLFEDKLHLSLLNKEYEVHQNFSCDNVNVEMKGAIDGFDSKSLSLIVQDPNLIEAGIGDHEGGLGVYDLSLQPKAEKQNAYAVNYRTSQPSASPILNKQFEAKVLDERFIKGWKVQDLPGGIQDELLLEVKKKVPTFQEKEQGIQEKLEQVLTSLKAGEILPVHEEGACTRCPYKAICRNGAIRKEKGAEPA